MAELAGPEEIGPEEVTDDVLEEVRPAVDQMTLKSQR